jgi:hypothetical protein
MTFAQLQKEWIRGDRNVVAQDLAAIGIGVITSRLPCWPS